MKRLSLLALLVFINANCARAQTSAGGPVHFPATASPTASPTFAPQVAPSPGTTSPAQPAFAPTSPPADSGGDIRDIHGPVVIPYAWLWAAEAAGVLFVCGLLFVLWRWLRTPKKPTPKLAYEVALSRLEATRELMTPGTAREYAFAVSEVIRNYIEERFGEKAARRTTEEFLSDLLAQTGTPLAQHGDRLRDFLEHCELPKFARSQLSVPDMEAMYESARTFLLSTGPVTDTTPAAVNLPPVPTSIASSRLAPAK